MLGDVCATAQTAESIRIAVIKKVFFIYILLDFSASILVPAARLSGSSVKNLEYEVGAAVFP
jgi:hypothetical protein